MAMPETSPNGALEARLRELVAKWRTEARFGSDGYKNHYHQLEECADDLERALREEPAGNLPRVIAAPVPLQIGSQFTIQQGDETFYAEVIPKKKWNGKLPIDYDK